MRIIGVDLHARQQTVAALDTDSGEVMETTLQHSPQDQEEVRSFYAALPRPALVGLEASGSMQWFLGLLDELGVEYSVGHPTEIRKAESRKQKHDRRDAALLLRLLRENRFPAIWLPSAEQRDQRSLLLHRHQLVRMRVGLENVLQALALNHGLRLGTALWSVRGQQQLAELPLAPYTAGRRNQLQALRQKLETQISKLDEQVQREACRRPLARLLMTHPGVGPVTALATEVFLGDPQRFADRKALASYVGIIPREYSSGGHQRLGGVTKQGSPLLRFLWGEAGAHAARRDPELKRFYRRKLVQKGLGKARVAVARKLGIRLWIMLGEEIDYQEICRRVQRQQKTVKAVAGG